MKKSALTITLLVALLSIVPITGLAQKGWVKASSSTWTRRAKVQFNNISQGFVQEILGQYGAIFYVTSDGGSSWIRFSQLEGWEVECTNGSPFKEMNSYRIAGAHLTGLHLNVVGSAVKYLCWWEDIQYDAKAWTFNLGTATMTTSSYGGRGPDDLDELSDGTLVASSREIEFQGDHGPGTVLYSTSGGDTWRELLPGIDLKSRTKIGRFLNADSGIVTTGYYDSTGKNSGIKVYWTTTGGNVWRIDSMRSRFGELGFSGPYYYTDGRWYLRHEDTVFSTSDMGITWRVVSAAPEFRSFGGHSFYDEGHGYRIQHSDTLFSTIQFTSDTGKTWTDQVTVEGHLDDLSAPSERVAYAVGANGLLYKTTDGGGRFAYVVPDDQKHSSFKAWIDGHDIVIESEQPGEVMIYDLLGRQIARGIEQRFSGMPGGFYVVTLAGESLKVVIPQ